MTDDDFHAFSELVHQKAGINLHEGKKELVRARLARRIREGSFNGFRDYFNFIISEKSGDELVQLLDSISTNLTHFFREPRHFNYMAQDILPRLSESGKKNGKQLRIWSAGCSTGEEPYSIAMVVMENMPSTAGWDIKILATDLSTKVLATASGGMYYQDSLKDVSQSLLRRYFQKGRGKWEGYYRVKPSIKKTIYFRRLNLIEPFPFSKPFDLIFCRNVMIYFNKETQADLVARFYDALAKDGHLFIGHSESLTGVSHNFKYVQPTIYRKT